MFGFRTSHVSDLEEVVEWYRTHETNPDAIPTVNKSAVAGMLVSSPHTNDILELVKKHLEENVRFESLDNLVADVERRTADVLSQAPGRAIMKAARGHWDHTEWANELRTYIATVVRPFEYRAGLAYQWVGDVEPTSVTTVAGTTRLEAYGTRLDNAVSQFYVAFHQEWRVWQNNTLHFMLATTRIALEEGEGAGKFERDGKGEWLSMVFSGSTSWRTTWKSTSSTEAPPH